MPDLKAETAYLHRHIPATAFMQVVVSAYDESGLQLNAPLAPNINHQQTVFGGSAASLATLACWTLIHIRLSELPFLSNIVIRRSQMQYDQPIDADFSAFCSAPATADWQRFLDDLNTKDKARITLHSSLFCHEQKTADFSGEFVALKQK